jgi:hypothetical protein
LDGCGVTNPRDGVGKERRGRCEVWVEPEKKRNLLSLFLDEGGNAKVRTACNESTDIIAAMEYLFQD